MEFSIKVNDELIEDRKIDHRLQYFLSSESKEYSDSLNKQDKLTLKIEIAHEMVDELLLIQYGRSQQLTPSQNEVKSKMDELKEEYNLSISIENPGNQEKELWADVTNELTLEKVIQKINSNLPLDDEHLKEFYDNNRKQLSVGKAVKVRHILVKNNDEIKAMKKIKTALNRLQNGDDFNQVAQDMSECPSKQNGGDLGFITKGVTNEIFEKKAFGIKKETISDIFETEKGYHIIEVLKKVKNYTPPFGVIKENLKDYIYKNARENEINELLYELRDSAEIEYIGFNPEV